jgi:WD40 repeat protein
LSISLDAQMPHKADVRCLEFHPSLFLVATGSRDRTFKLWDRIEAAPVVSLAHEQHKLRRNLQQHNGDEAANVVAVSAAAAAATENGKQRVVTNRKARRIEANEVSAKAVAPSSPPLLASRFVWQCRSVGFYRDFPCSSAAFSGDGTALALGYGHHVTLWDWRDNALKSVLAQVRVHSDTCTASVTSHLFHLCCCFFFRSQRTPEDAVVQCEAEPSRVRLSSSLRHGATATTFARTDDDDEMQPCARVSEDDVKHLVFAGLSALLVAASARTVQCWNVLSSSLIWSFNANVISLSADRIGLAASSRIALAVYDGCDSPHTSGSAENSSSPFAKSRNQGRAHIVLLDAESPVPLGSWLLPESYIGSQVCTPVLLAVHSYGPPFIHGCYGVIAPGGPDFLMTRSPSIFTPFAQVEQSVLPIEARVPLYAVTFVPPLPAPMPPSSEAAQAHLALNSGIRTHDIFVLGPQVRR